jgi:hypothetical protein
MSIIIITRDRFKEEVFGYRDEARKIMKARGIIEVQTVKNSRTVFIRTRDILLAEVVSAEEEKRIAEEEAAAVKDNPHPGREPKFIAAKGGRR